MMDCDFSLFLFFNKVLGRSREISQGRRVVYAWRSKQSVSRCPRCSQGARSRKFDFVCEPFFQSVLSASWQFHHQRVNDEDGAEGREKRERKSERVRKRGTGAGREGMRSRGIKHARADVERSAPPSPFPPKSEKDGKRFSEGLVDLAGSKSRHVADEWSDETPRDFARQSLGKSGAR